MVRVELSVELRLSLLLLLYNITIVDLDDIMFEEFFIVYIFGQIICILFLVILYKSLSKEFHLM